MPARKVLKINRFTVMAMLQAARAEKLGLPSSAARSWGLNRAIFYAAAKQGFRHEGGPTGEPMVGEPAKGTYRLGDDYAYTDPQSSDLQFQIGDKPQTAAEFDRQIASRFGGDRNFRAAWSEAMDVVGGFPEEVLKSRRDFYATVYKPRRDQLVVEWAKRYGPPPVP